MPTNVDQQLHELLSDINLLYLDVNKKVLSKHGLRQVRYYTMHHLHLEPGLSLGQLSDLTLVDRASLSRMVFTMEKEGLIQREANTADRRLFKLSLTKKGHGVYKIVQADMDADIQRRFEAVGDEAKTKLLGLNLELKHVLLQHIQSQNEA